jgi:hypothetical protein
MRALVVSLITVSLAACGGDEAGDVDPTPAPDERIDYWAELLAQRQFETRDQPPYLCQAIDYPESIALADDASIVNQIPREILENVSIRTLEKLREKCVSDRPTVPPECEGIEERYNGVPPFNAACPAEVDIPILPAPSN